MKKKEHPRAMLTFHGAREAQQRRRQEQYPVPHAAVPQAGPRGGMARRGTASAGGQVVVGRRGMAPLVGSVRVPSQGRESPSTRVPHVCPAGLLLLLLVSVSSGAVGAAAGTSSCTSHMPAALRGTHSLLSSSFSPLTRTLWPARLTPPTLQRCERTQHMHSVPSHCGEGEALNTLIYLIYTWS